MGSIVPMFMTTMRHMSPGNMATITNQSYVLTHQQNGLALILTALLFLLLTNSDLDNLCHHDVFVNIEVEVTSLNNEW